MRKADLQEVGMDKISSIIHSSPRVQAVDMRESSVRPGTPAFGRLEGVSALAKASPNLTETAARASAIADDAATWKNKDLKSAAMAAEMTKSFFAKPTPPVPAAVAELPQSMPTMKPMAAQTGFFADRESVPAGFKADSPGAFRTTALARMPSFETSEMEMGPLQQPEGLYPKGSFIDRSA